jgi:hypothetical protein
MAWSLVQQQATQSTAGAGSLPANSTAGNLLIAVAGNGSATAITAPSGWSSVKSITNGTISEVYIWAYFNTVGGQAAFTFAGGSGALSVSVAEFTCTSVATVAAASDTGSGVAGAVAAITVATAGTAHAGDLVICGAMEHLTATSAITWTAPTSFTNISTLAVATATNHTYAGQRLSAASAGAQSVIMTSSVASTSATGWTGVVATFSEPGGAAIGTPELIMAVPTGA